MDLASPPLELQAPLFYSKATYTGAGAGLPTVPPPGADLGFPRGYPDLPMPWVTARTREGRFGAGGGWGVHSWATGGPQAVCVPRERTFWARKSPRPFSPEAGATRTTQGHGAPQGPPAAAPQRHRHTWSEQ